jgi:PIN domain nuclease of toxin-antitoxin system
MLAHVTDTHSLIWYLEDNPLLSPKANDVFDACDRGEIVIYIPTICLVEILYLQEKWRIPSDLKVLLDEELRSGNSRFTIADLDENVVDVMAQIPRNVVPDLPDRIIAATALSLGLPLVTKDAKIHSCKVVETIW